MCHVLSILIAALVIGQTSRPPGFVRGMVASRTPSTFDVRAITGILYRYRTDSKTWIERDHERISTDALRPGETLEVVSDRDPDPIRYARLVHVIQPPIRQSLPVSTGGVYRLKPAAPLPVAVFNGLVVARQLDSITLRTRLDGEKTIYLRTDTQCLHNGEPVDAARLLPNTRVYVIAVQSAEQELDASQVVWGEILKPLH